MPFWPFRRKPPEPLTPTELRDRLINAAISGNGRQLRKMAQQFKQQIAEQASFLTKVPDEVSAAPEKLQQYAQAMIGAADFLANHCGVPEFLNALIGTPDTNPLIQLMNWYPQVAPRMERLEYDALIAEARALIDQVQTLRGESARQNEAMLRGHLGNLLFQSGKVQAAVEPLQTALELCREIQDWEGEQAYLNSLLEAHRYLGNRETTISYGEELIRRSTERRVNCDRLKKRLEVIRQGEPLCRVVCHKDGQEHELEELQKFGEGRFQFFFQRNRLSLQMATQLVQSANQFASQGQHAAAQKKYQQAREIDPYDPDPLYQSGTCLLEMGAYRGAREAFEEVERLAPGWFRCRSDRWLAEQLESGAATDEQFRTLRALEDCGMPPKEALNNVRQAIERHPAFAPLYLILGNALRDHNQTRQAIENYRQGLAVVSEPDLESRLLCAAAALLPEDSPERSGYLARVETLQGSLIAQATARLMGLKQR